MTEIDFARVNGGIAFSGPFVPQNANDLRTNGELLWLLQAMRMSTGTVDVSSYTGGGGYTYPTPQWNGIMQAYVANALLYTEGLQTVQLMPTCELVSRLNPTGYAPTNYARPGVIVDSQGRQFMFYTDSSTGYAAAATSSGNNAAQANWTDVTLPSASTQFASLLAVKQTESKVVVSGFSTALGSAFMHATLVSDGTVSANLINGRAGGSPMYSIASSPTLTVGIEAVEPYVSNTYGLACNASGVVSTITLPLHTEVASTSGAQAQLRFIGYDQRTTKFVQVCSPNGSSSYPSSIMWTTSDDGTTWSGTVGWKRVQITNLDGGVSGDTIFVQDFTITDSGIWVALCSGFSGTYMLVISIDSGATWLTFRLATLSTALSPKLLKGGPNIGVFSRTSTPGVYEMTTSGPLAACGTYTAETM